MIAPLGRPWRQHRHSAKLWSDVRFSIVAQALQHLMALLARIDYTIPASDPYIFVESNLYVTSTSDRFNSKLIREVSKTCCLHSMLSVDLGCILVRAVTPFRPINTQDPPSLSAELLTPAYNPPKRCPCSSRFQELDSARRLASCSCYWLTSRAPSASVARYILACATNGATRQP